MAKKDEWNTCLDCETEFKVISDNHDTIAYCPFCGYELAEEIDEDLDEDEIDW